MGATEIVDPELSSSEGPEGPKTVKLHRPNLLQKQYVSTITDSLHFAWIRF